MKAAEVTLALKEAIVNGAEQAKQIYDRAMGFLLNDVKNLKCEDLVKAEVETFFLRQIYCPHWLPVFTND